jgi:2-keto-3-deoxy-6-phosphogluconate aldolase
VTPTDIFCKHVLYLAVQNVTLGCSGTTFCPHGAISRSDMAIFVAKAIVAPAGGPGVPQTYTDATTGLHYSCNPASPNLHFTDIGVNDAFCKHVHFLWAQNIVSGCTATTYCPTQGVTRDQMARFLGNAFNLVLYAP